MALEKCQEISQLLLTIGLWGGIAIGVALKDYSYAAFMMAWLVYVRGEMRSNP